MEKQVAIPETFGNDWDSLPQTFDARAEWLASQGAEVRLETDLAFPPGATRPVIIGWFVTIIVERGYGLTVSAEMQGRGETPYKALESLVYQARLGRVHVTYSARTSVYWPEGNK
jgi:hypothetical protein